MQHRTMTRLLAAGAVAGTAGWRTDAQAQEYPTKAVAIVVPYAAGTVADLIARTLANELGIGLKQPFVVDNRPGAYQVVSTNYVARQPADG